jgi:hypothetical protein
MTMNRITFYPTGKNKLDFLSVPIEKMFTIMDRFVEDNKAIGRVDVPYHYNERATLSLLAGAIWRSDENNFVFEEFRTEKKRAEVVYKGRQDIWFRVSGQACYGEAKQQWIPLYRVRNDVNKLLSVLEQEMKAARQALPTIPTLELPAFGLGILFVTPYILKTNISVAHDNLTKHQKALEEGLGRWCDQTGSQVLWARYVREELLHESGCYRWSTGETGSCPSLDTLICTPLTGPILPRPK